MLSYDHVSQISGMCYSEEIFSKGVTYDWPATCSGSSVTFTCPNNPIYSASRECSVEGIWQDFDQDACGVLTEELKNLLTTQVSGVVIIYCSIFSSYKVCMTL